MNRVGLSREIIVALSILTGAALLLMGGVLIILTRDELTNQKVVEGIKQAHILSRSLVESLQNSNPYKRSSVLEKLPAFATNDIWTIYDSRLQPVEKNRSQSQPLQQLSTPAQRSIRFAREPLVETSIPTFWPWLQSPGKVRVQIIAPIFDQSQFLGALQLTLSLDNVANRIGKATLLALGYTLLFGLLIVISGYYLLLRTIVRPVRQLVKATQSIAAGQFDVTTPISEAPTEIFALAKAFEQMILALQKSHRKTAEHILSLEATNQTLRETRRELILSERMASVGHLAAGMAHEVGNPLGAMIGYLDYLRGELESPARIDIVDRVLAETGRIDHLVRDLLDFAAARPSGDHSCNASQVAQEAFAFLDRQGKFRDLHLQLQLAKSLPPVPIDSHRLMQVLVNLLLNACDETRPGGRINLISSAYRQGVKLRVEDTGTGISDQVLPHIFDPFYSTKPEGQGRGLGLAICHRIVVEAGGTIEVESCADSGTAFTLILPVAEQHYDR